MHKIIYHKKCWDDIEKLDISRSEKIIMRIEESLSKDPVNLGKPLNGGYAGCYRYRYGDYRVIYKVLLQEKIICILGIKHRKEAYK